MLDLYTKLQARLAQEDGQTMAEYAVVSAVIAIGIFAALGVLSGAIGNALSTVTRTSSSCTIRSSGTIDRTGRGAEKLRGQSRFQMTLLAHRNAPITPTGCATVPRRCRARPGAGGARCDE